MPKGRPRKPDGLKVLEGTFRHDRANPHQPRPELGEPEPPAPLTPDETAIWARVVTVTPPGVLTKADGFVLDLFARLYAEFLSVDQELKTRGRIVELKDTKGRVIAVKASPYLKYRAALVPEIRRLGEQLGLTPSARSKIHATDAVAEAVDPFGALLGAGGIAGRKRA